MNRLSLWFFPLLVANSIANPMVPPSPGSMLSQFVPHSNVMLNIQELADLAMSPMLLSNQSMLELYQESTEIINATNADTVLYQLEPLGNASSAQRPILVMAVVNPSGPSHDDLMKQFHVYFVNLNDSPPNITDAGFPVSDFISNTKHNTWTIVRNFFKNQVNALVGAFWLPYNVGAQAMQQASNEHAEYVAAGSTFGTTVFKPIILKAIDMPTNIAQRVVNLTTGNANSIKAAEQHSKLVSSGAVDVAANGVASAAEATSQLAVQYLVRPIGAFAGFHLNRAGSTLAGFGQRLDSTGIQLALLGQRLGLGAHKAVDAGATAIAWGLDNKVVLPDEQRTHNGTDPMHVST